MTQADALSRATINAAEDVEDNLKIKKILDVHKDLGHRKTILKELLKERIQVSESELRKTLLKCESCTRKDKKRGRSCSYIETSRPGEIVGVDMLEITDRQRIIVLVDYFTRLVYAKLVTTKEAGKIVNFLKETYGKLKFSKMIVDNGREFDNNLVKKWTEEVGVELQFAVPYYHASNGRVERVNRTIRESLKRMGGPLKVKLKKAIEAYNKSTHRAIGISPIEAQEEKKWSEIIERQKQYGKEFSAKNTKIDKFTEGEKVFVRNEEKQGKMDDEFKEKAEVIRHEYGNVYVIIMNDGKLTRRHVSQLRRF